MTFLQKFDYDTLASTAVNRFDQTMRLMNYANTTHRFIRNLKEYASAKLDYAVYISVDDPVYITVMREVIKLAPTQNHKSIELGSIFRHGKGWTEQLEVLLSLESIVVINIAGYDVKVTMVDSNVTHSSKIGENKAGGVSYRSDMRLCFLVRSAKGHQAVMEFLHKCAEIHHSSVKNPSMYVLNTWGEWRARKEISSRSLNHIVLKEGQLERICNDLASFMESEHLYNDRNIPYHRGYLFHGPPGTGKTSLASVLANHFHLDVYFISLNDLDKDTVLMGVVSEITAQSVLIIEDIDIATASTSRESDDEDEVALFKHQQASLFGLLNALDGFGTPHGLITIMTTNYAHNLDKALIRPGRVDMVELLDYADDYQVSHLFKNFYYQDDLRPFPSVEGLEISPADILECFKRHMMDKDAGFFAAKKYIEAKRAEHRPVHHEKFFEAVPVAPASSCC